jgi:predicted acylesterase/phospholipase RssA
VNAFILSGGGTLGSIQVGMLQALLEADIRPEVLIGTSIGAVNAAFLAADPSLERVEALRELWHGVRPRDVFTLNPLRMGHALLRRGSLFPAERWRASPGSASMPCGTTISEMSVEVDLGDATPHETGPAEAGLR